MTEFLALSATDIRELVNMRDIIAAVEEAFRAYGLGASKLGPITLLLLDKYEGEHEIKTGYVDNYCISTKILTWYKGNPQRYGIPALTGVIVLNDINDGRTLAVVDGAYITATRTGAAGAVAAKYLARKDSETVGVIGAGMQGRNQVAALKEIIRIKHVKVYDAIQRASAIYVKEMRDQHKLDVEEAESASDAVRDADIIITATQSTKALVMNDWVKEGTHINAIGADAPGKQELDPAILTRADKVVVDSLTQCVERGEIQTAVKMGILKKENIYAELSDIVLGKKKGRTDAKEITVYDATGMAVQDITTAYTVYGLAKKKGLGTIVRMN
jgi:alanine dehydrogenase